MTTSNSAKKGSSHSEYLLMLQERNRIMKKLQNKNNEQKLLEQREQGFSLYLNGANASLQLPVRRHSRKATNRNTKTAGSDRLVGDHDNNDTQSRAKTAPMKERLKWGHHSYEVTTSDGDVVHVPAPDAKFTGNYEEDFEATTLDNTVQLDLSSDNTKVLKNALKEIMGGDGDMSSDNCSDDSIGHSDNEEVCHENMASFPTMQASVTKTTRSLSAVKKKSMTTTTDAGVSHDVIVALQAENDAISHTHNLAQQPHLPHDANCIHIPLHPPATPSTENTIAIVTEQVKQMNCRQQKKLLRWLDRLERLPSPPPSAVTPSDFSTAKLHSCSINSNPQPDLHSTIRVLSCSTDNDSHSCSTDTDLHSIANTKPLVARKRSPYSAKEHRRSSFDWLNSDNVKIQRSQSVGKLSNVIGVDEDVLIPRLPSGRTSGLRGLLSGGRHQLEDDPQLQTKSESHLPTFLDEQPLPTHVAMARGSTAVITSLHDNLDLPSAEDTDVTDQYHMTGSCDPVSDITTKSHDMDTLLASLSIFDTTHLGRLGTAVSMEMSSSNYGDSLDISVDTVEPEQQSQSSVIPILPRGRHVIFNIRSTWGDHHYVGLNGIELFTELGTPATVQSITAEPADINTLPGYHSDPRVVTNLLDGVNMTRDDFHMWLTPFTPGRDHVIHITLDDVTTIAMIRIWNYNKSRIHSCRGARHIIVTLDNQVVFNGEVARASGELTGSIDNYGDTILFTVDDDVLMKIANHDQVFQQEQMGGADVEEEDNSRPSTGGVSEVLCDPVEITMEMANQITSPLLANELQLQLLNTWGDPHYIGLTGLAVLGVGLEPLPLAAEQLAASPCDLNDLPEYTDDDRTLDKLVDGVNVTTCDSHMWLAPYTPGGDHVITITLATPALVAGIQVWNYNKSTEDTSRGVKEVIISIDGHVISDGCNWLFRRVLVFERLHSTTKAAGPCNEGQ
ncbi:uncharacterized protein [Dysidea avara]|uniref:uncharacterized protein isoform X2 n=1 Tax=Dysidea avara TaxID=196820 RepID=UPI003332A2EA